MASLYKSNILKISIFLTVLILGITFFYLKTTKPKATPLVIPTVTIAKVSTQKISQKITLPGTLVAPTIVKIRPRVEGQIIGIHFRDGDIIKKDQLLFTLDDDMLQAQLSQAEGALARDKANLQYAEAEVKRNRPLVERTYTSTSKFEQTIASAESGRGTLKSNQGLIDQYKLQIQYTKIYSPLEGRIGFNQVDKGNVIRPTDANPLAIIMQLDPIEIHFALPEKYLSYLQNVDLTHIEARLYYLNKQPYEKKGHLKSIDNQVDITSGTLLVGAEFDNKEYKLLPGQYMTVEFALSAQREAMVIPIEAVQIGQSSSYVYVYDTKDQTAHYRQVQTEVFDDQTSIITGGLQVGDVVITSGQLKLKDKIKVKVLSSSSEQSLAMKAP